jgi:6-phosphogluconolactonase (cycloisomerase 2 family)
VDGPLYPSTVAVDPAGKLLYVANADNANVLAFSIDANTGQLTPVPGSPFPTGFINSNDDVVDPSGRFLYVSTNGSQVSGYTINSATGSLTPIPGSPFPAGSFTFGLAIDRTGRFLYATNPSSNNLSAYLVDSNTGALSPVPGSPFAAGNFPEQPAIDPTGSFLYVVNLRSNNVSGYRINPSTGTLTPILGSPFTGASGGQWMATVSLTPPTQMTILPEKGGNTGNVTVQIFGNGFQSGAIVSLTGLEPDIVGSNTVVPYSSVLTTTFDLTAATPGARTVVITNPDNTPVSLPSGFTVEQGGSSEIWIEIVGRDKIRIGAPQQYYAVAHNRGKIDSSTSLIAVTAPSAIQLTPGSDPAYAFVGQRTLSSVSTSSAKALAAATTVSELTSYLWAVPSIMPGGTSIVPFSLTFAAGAVNIGSFVLSARWNSNSNLPDPATTPFETYMQAVGQPEPDYSHHCISCFAEAQAMGNAFGNARLAYSTMRLGSSDFNIQVIKLGQDVIITGAALIAAEGAVVLAGLEKTGNGQLYKAGAERP